MKIRFFLFLFFILIFSCQDSSNIPESNPEVKVIAHRGDWRNHPENSLSGIQSCIDMGVDMVEIDLALTKDSVLVLMHDKTLERTTNGSGEISNWTYDSLMTLSLKDHQGNILEEKIPTFLQAMQLAKDKIEAFVDKAYPVLPQAVKILEKTGTLNQAHFLGFVSAAKFQSDYPELSKKVNYMPLVLSTDTTEAFIQSYLPLNTQYFLYSFPEDDENLFATIPLVIEDQRYAMATTQVPYFCGGHTDSVSIVDPTMGWGWIAKKGFNAICTDTPQLLLEYLRSEGLHE